MIASLAHTTTVKLEAYCSLKQQHLRLFGKCLGESKARREGLLRDVSLTMRFIAANGEAVACCRIAGEYAHTDVGVDSVPRSISACVSFLDHERTCLQPEVYPRSRAWVIIDGREKPPRIAHRLSASSSRMSRTRVLWCGYNALDVLAPGKVCKPPATMILLEKVADRGSN